MPPAIKTSRTDPGQGVIVFGEVLFDVFPDGRKAIGGAPFNVSVHLAAMGLSPVFISRVGDDELGHKVLQAMAAWSLDSSQVSLDQEHATGTVDVIMDQGDISYEITQDVAWDHIPKAKGAKGSLLYHGSLAARSPGSAASLKDLAQAMPSFVDLNLRPPWFTAPQVLEMVKEARTLKLNRFELATVCDFLAIPKESLQIDSKRLAEEAGVRTLLVTDGENGACVTSSAGFQFMIPALPQKAMKDSVGAGDAFSSVCLAGEVLGWDMPRTLARASALASAICTIRGALPDDPEWHASHIERWSS